MLLPLVLAFTHAPSCPIVQAVGVPVSVVWGEEDPWEKIEWGREFAKYPSVEVGCRLLPPCAAAAPAAAAACDPARQVLGTGGSNPGPPALTLTAHAVPC